MTKKPMLVDPSKLWCKICTAELLVNTHTLIQRKDLSPLQFLGEVALPPTDRAKRPCRVTLQYDVSGVRNWGMSGRTQTF